MFCITKSTCHLYIIVVEGITDVLGFGIFILFQHFHGKLSLCCYCLFLLQCYYALGLLHFFNGNSDAALNIWTRIVDQKLLDSTFPGVDYVVNFLTQ